MFSFSAFSVSVSQYLAIGRTKKYVIGKTNTATRQTNADNVEENNARGERLRTVN